MALKLGHQFVVFGVRPDPEPNDLVAGDGANCAVVQSNSSGKDRKRFLHAPELQTRMLGIHSEALIGSLCLSSYFLRKLGERIPKTLRSARLHSDAGSSGSVLPERYSERASSARWASAF